jgi:transcriptional regulator with XRE-family HTH domain
MKKTLGERIRELREDVDLSLRELARRLDVSAAFMSDVELGRRFPSDELLGKIAKELKTTLEDLEAHDARPPVDEIRRRAAHSSDYGFAMRRLVDSGVSAEEIEKALDDILGREERQEEE